MFGGEDLADVMLYGGLSDDSGEHGDNKLESVLYAEQKSLLVALTRASEQVTASAVYNDDTTRLTSCTDTCRNDSTANGMRRPKGGNIPRSVKPDGSKVWTPILAAWSPPPAWRSPYTHEVPRDLKMPWMRCDCWQAMASKPLTSRVGRSSTRSRMRLPAPARWDRGGGSGTGQGRGGNRPIIGAADRNIVAIRRGQHLGMSRLLDDGKPVHWSARRQCGDLVRLADPRRRRNRQQRGPGRGGLAR